MIAASGDYWSYTVVDKGKIVSQGESEDEDMDWVPDITDLEMTFGTWSPDFRYGSKESAEAESVLKMAIDELFMNV